MLLATPPSADRGVSIMLLCSTKTDAIVQAKVLLELCSGLTNSIWALFGKNANVQPVPQDNYHQCQYAIRFPRPHGAPPSTPMPTICCGAAILVLRRSWWRRIEREDTCRIVRLQRIHIT